MGPQGKFQFRGSFCWDLRKGYPIALEEEGKYRVNLIWFHLMWLRLPRPCFSDSQSRGHTCVNYKENLSKAIECLYIIQTWIRFISLIGVGTWVWLLWLPHLVHLGFTSCGGTPYPKHLCPISRKSYESNYIDISPLGWQLPDWTGNEDMFSMIAILITLRVLFVWWNNISTTFVQNFRENLSKQRYWYIFQKKDWSFYQTWE